MPQVLTLNNGIPLAHQELPAMESVSIGVLVDIGARHDPAPLSGMAHFAEHLFFKGTATRNAKALALATEASGGSADAFTSEEHTCFYLRGPAEEFAHYAEVLLDMFLNSTFPADEVEREREVISEEISMYHEQPSSRAEDLLCQLMWPKHPLGRAISGDEKSLRRISRAHLLRHTADYYGQKNIVLSVAGNVSAATVTSVLNKLLSKKLRPGKRPTKRPDPRSGFGKGPRFSFETRPIEQSQVALAFHGPGRDVLGSGEAFKLLNVLLGDNTSSRLWQELREKRGWCYQIDTDPSILSDTGLFQIFAGVDPENLNKALHVVYAELQKLVEKPIAIGELQRAVSYTTGSNRMSLENTASYMLWIGESLLFHREVHDLETTNEKLKKVTPADIQSLAKTLFVPENMGLVVVGPNGDEAEIRDAMEI